MAEIGKVEEREEGVFEWTVRDFMSLPDKVDDRYYSPSFSFDGARWHLVMFPNGESNKSEGYIDVYLGKVCSGPPIKMNFSLGLKTINNEIFRETHSTYNSEEEFDYAGTCFRRSRILGKQSEIAPSSHLTIVCRMKNVQSHKAARDSSASGSAVKSKILFFETVTPKCRELERSPQRKRTGKQGT